MSNLIVIGFGNEADGFEMRAALAELESRDLIEIGDAVVATREADGEVRLHQATGSAVAGAGFVGKLIGRLFGSAGNGSSGTPADVGINDDFMTDLGTTLRPGNSALFVLVRKSAPDKVLEALTPFAGKGRVLQTSLTRDKEEELRAFIEGR